jgi:hypothetical protein
VLGRPEMLNRVLVPGRIAAPDVAAFHAHPKLVPWGSDEDAAVAARTTGLDVPDVVDVRARHALVGLHHDEGRVRIRWVSVESIDGMRLMTLID